MRCFNHLENHAVGICKYCGKALCPECTVDTDRGLACQGQCAAEVEKIGMLIERNMQQSPISDNVLKNLRKNTFMQAAFILSVSAFLLITWIAVGKNGTLLGFMGIAFLLYGGFVIRRAISIPK